MGIPIPTILPNDCLKEEAKQLINLSDRIYTQLRELEEELQRRGIGMADYLDSLDGSSIDEPRSIQDPESARRIRQQIYRLRNEHKRVMEQIESMLHRFHESNSSGSSSRNRRRRQRPVVESSDDDSDNDSSNRMDPLLEQSTSSTTTQLQPFAKVSAVLPGSPASDAGLQRNDLVLQFGTITKANHHEQHTLAAIAQENLGRPLGIKILRNFYEEQTLYPTPRNGWGGLGALGCHILPL